MTKSPHREAIHAMSAYLRPEVQGRHADLILQELRDLLQQVPITHDIAISVINQRRRHLIEDLLARGPFEVPRAEDEAEQRDIIRRLRNVNYAKLPANIRMLAFELHSQFCPKNDPELMTLQASQAMMAEDLELLSRIEGTYHQDIHATALLDTKMIEESADSLAPFWARLFKRIDLNDPAVSKFAHIAARQSAARSTALLIKSGFRMHDALTLAKHYGFPWPERLRQRISSAHGEMSLLAVLPDLEDIAGMKSKPLQILLAGPSKKDLRREAKRKKQEEWLARQAQQAPEQATQAEDQAE